ncbi:MAG: hypothetical protein KatS3mg124_1438 [Porticoccaceae bacterium]|nr:MAG: hypothetical protein KatS3mg124_1438 [Porticoccaceae bacterium]
MRSGDGYTLVEVLVALAVAALLWVAAHRALDAVLALAERAAARFAPADGRERALNLLGNDLLHLRPRPVRDLLGGVVPAYRVPADPYALEFTRGGMADLAPLRVAYRVVEGRLVRATWARLDGAAGNTPRERVLAEGIAALRVEQLDELGRWLPYWPPAGRGAPTEGLPRLIRLVLEWADGDVRTLVVPGVDGSFPGLFRAPGGSAG